MFFQYGEREIAYLAGRDKRLGQAIEKIGHIDREVDSDIFSAIVHHILGQQISTAAQATVWNRLLYTVGSVSADSLTALGRERLQQVGTTYKKADYILDLAEQVRRGTLDPGQLWSLSDEEIIRRPANRFVYSFIGVSNFLPVTEKGGKVCLALGGEPVLFDAPPQGYVSGKKNVMGVRPMDIVFDAESPIRATIRRDTFLGNQYDYQVELMGRELRVERNALDVLADPTRYEAGQEVGLKFLNVKFYEEEAKA